ncbi:MAG: J domain-containing protein [Thermomicrobiales bacterium]
MTQAIVRIQSPEERAYARYLTEIETRKRRVADLQAELEALKLALGRFEAEYHARVGVLFVELDRVRLAIDEYERRIAWLQSHPDGDPAEAEREIEREFRTRHEEIHTEEEETRRYERAFQRDQARPKLAADAEQEVKQLYRDLAKRYHPDLARTDAERRQRETIMQQVNAAFHDRNLDGLRGLFREAEVEDPAFEMRSIGEKLVWAIREVARLDEVIADRMAVIAEARTSDTFQLLSRQQKDEAVIEMLESDLRRELAFSRDRLAELIATYRHLLPRTMT